MPGLPGGCTRDLVHRFYQEQYQLDGGKQDRYVTGSDSVGMTMGYYDTTELPIYEYLHSRRRRTTSSLDHFFQAAFGGSFLNHQYLVAARRAADRPDRPHAVLDASGFPNASYPLYQPDRRRRRRRRDPGLRPADDDRRARLRRLRRQHRPAVLPADQRRSARGCR